MLFGRLNKKWVRDRGCIIHGQHDMPVNINWDFFTWRSIPPVGQGLHIVEASRSHSDTHRSVGLLLTSDQPDKESSTWQTPLSRRDPNSQSQKASGRRPTDRTAAGIGRAKYL